MESVQETYMPEEKIAGKRNSGYSIHTYELEVPLERDVSMGYKALLDKYCIYQKRRSCYYNKHYFYIRHSAFKKKHTGHLNTCFYSCYDNEQLFLMGISDIRFIEYRIFGGTYNDSTYAAGITFHVNPRILLGHSENKYICIVPSDELEYIMPVLIRTLAPYEFEEADLRKAVIKRLDICANIDLSDQASAERYLKLLRKGGYYRGLRSKYMPVDPVSHRRMHPPNEVRFINFPVNKGYTRETLSIYLKYAQMQEKTMWYDVDEIERAKGQVRFELRIGRRKNAYLRSKYECRSSSDLINLAETIGSDILTKYLEGIYGKGRFVKYSRALEMVEDAEHHQIRVKDKMHQIIEQTRKTDLVDAFSCLSPSEKSLYRKYFNELGISPVTLRDSWKEDGFENPVTYIITQNVNER